MFSEPFWEYLNSLSWVSVMIYVAKILDTGFTTSMCLRNFGSNILRVWFKSKMFNFLTLF